MAEFKAIETQEQFDSMIKDRLERAKADVRKEYADYESIKSSLAEKTNKETELTGKVSDYEKQIGELKGKLSKSETDSAKTRIAYELGLPFEMCSRLVGTTEEEIRKDAEALSKFVRVSPPAPLYNPEGGQSSAKDAALKQMVQSLRK